jgi:hypothetical protein
MWRSCHPETTAESCRARPGILKASQRIEEAQSGFDLDTFTGYTLSSRLVHSARHTQGTTPVLQPFYSSNHGLACVGRLESRRDCHCEQRCRSKPPSPLEAAEETLFSVQERIHRQSGSHSIRGQTPHTLDPERARKSKSCKPAAEWRTAQIHHWKWCFPS